MKRALKYANQLADSVGISLSGCVDRFSLAKTKPEVRAIFMDIIRNDSSRIPGYVSLTDIAQQFYPYDGSGEDVDTWRTNFISIVRGLEIIRHTGFFTFIPGDCACPIQALTPAKTYITWEKRNGKLGKLNMGQYKVCFYFATSWQVRVHPYKRNRMPFTEYFHPFLSVSGNPCWGSAAELVHSCESRKDLPEFAEFLRTLLTTYHKDAYPFLELSAFKQVPQEEEEEEDVD